MTEQRGMVMDFSFLKDVMITKIYTPCDHGLILWEHDPLITNLNLNLYDAKGVKLLKIGDVPTAENLAKYWFDEVVIGIEEFFQHVDITSIKPTLKCIRVWETPNCLAIFPTE